MSSAEKSKLWRIENPDKDSAARARQTESRKRKLREDPIYAAQERARGRVKSAARRKDPAKRAQDAAQQKIHMAEKASTPAGWLDMALWRAKNVRTRRGIAFNLSASDVMLPTHCPVTRRELHYGAGRGDPDMPSLDRVIPTLGYVRGNVRIISFFANRCKSDCTDPNIFRTIADYLEDAARLRGEL